MQPGKVSSSLCEVIFTLTWPQRKPQRLSPLISVSLQEEQKIGIENKIYLEDWINLDSCAHFEIHIFMVNVTKY